MSGLKYYQVLSGAHITMLDIHSERYGVISIVHLNGLLTRETLGDAEEAWNDQMDGNPDVIALDFRGVSQVDSISINHLFKISEKTAARQVKLVIYGATEHIRKLFELVKLDRVAILMTKRGFESEYMKGL